MIPPCRSCQPSLWLSWVVGELRAGGGRAAVAGRLGVSGRTLGRWLAEVGELA